MTSTTPHLQLIAGTGPEAREAEVARLLDDPDGDAAWEKLKQLRRRIIPAANSPLACVESEARDTGLPKTPSKSD